MDQLFGAIDLGASSGRVIAGIFGNEKLELTEIHRFANGPLEDGDKLFWDFASLQNEIAAGLHKLGEFAPTRTFGGHVKDDKKGRRV